MAIGDWSQYDPLYLQRQYPGTAQLQAPFSEFASLVGGPQSEGAGQLAGGEESAKAVSGYRGDIKNYGSLPIGGKRQDESLGTFSRLFSGGLGSTIAARTASDKATASGLSGLGTVGDTLAKTIAGRLQAEYGLEAAQNQLDYQQAGMFGMLLNQLLSPQSFLRNMSIPGFGGAKGSAAGGQGSLFSSIGSGVQNVGSWLSNPTTWDQIAALWAGY